ncbi:probable polygalacturonase At1g80170 isoform X3 [Rhododendron vialii]|uniref:probable polygalacturonase At1g80170 isoform X3 n=1 Tax=Rhododendron vialii TaxID=182163 RepID=UPI00265DD6BB|nr:probable polygalacturonase At1g80170 isoform X3 [Rhododendron vialii]
MKQPYRATNSNKNMEKILCVSFVGLLIIGAQGAAETLSDDIAVLRELESLDVEEGDDVELFDNPSLTSEKGSKVLVNVDGFGAVGDGVSDDTQAFGKAWKLACNTSNSVFLVPKGRRYLVNATRFRGPCSNNFIVQIEGTIVAPDEPKNWDPKNPRIWLDFFNLTGVLFQGGGVIDGSGSKWWAASCKRNKSNPCVGAPTVSFSPLVFLNLILEQVIQWLHEELLVSDSPNTDGIHITASTNVLLENCKIGTGDDCISIVSGSSNIKMKTIYCGPGHGISIGSLGKGNSTDMVTKVDLDTAFLKDTTNGLRIKTWQGGSGYVHSVRYQNVRMENVSYPIIIDQFYCDSPTTCQNQTSALEISKILYRNISGTSKTEIAMKFACSDTVPCKQLILNNIYLEKKDAMVKTHCNSVTGFWYGYVWPLAECLTSSDKDSIIKQTEEVDLAAQSRENLIHTEL